jgi:hypothetical protein
MKLTRYPPKAPYSMSEHHMFDTLPQNGSPVTSNDIADALGDGWSVRFPLKNVTVTMNLLIKKVDANKEPFQICKDGKYPGHPMVEYWLEKRKPHRKKANGK